MTWEEEEARTFRTGIALLISIGNERSKAPDVNDTRPSGADLRARQFLHILAPVNLHVGETRLRHDKRARQVRLDVRHPLLQHRLVLHGLAVGPVRVGDAAVVDEEVDPVVQKLGRLPDRLPYLVGGSQVAHCPADVLGVLVQVDFGGVLERVLVDVENEDLVSFGCKVSCYGSAHP